MDRSNNRPSEQQKVRLPSSEIESRFEEHLGFLFRSARAFDEGYEDEAKRLAVSLRVLLHETKNSHSIIAQLGLMETKFTDTASRIKPGHLGTSSGLTMMLITVGEGVRYIAPRDELPPSRIRPPAPFTSWWNDPIAKVGDREWSRREFVLALANKDGGAHVDPSLDKDYYELTRHNSLGWAYIDDYSSSGAAGDPAAASVRQIAYEVLDTFGRPQPNVSPA